MPNTKQRQEPTEAQRIFAQNIGLTISIDMSRVDVSDAISVKHYGDKPASPELRALAQAYGVEHFSYTAKRKLYDRIWDQVTAAGREVDMSRFFAYRLHRGISLTHGTPPAGSPNDPHIAKVADALAVDARVIASMRRYRGHELIWFGKWTAPNGAIMTGGSIRTTAYQTVADQLRPYVMKQLRLQEIELRKLTIQQDSAKLARMQPTLSYGAVDRKTRFRRVVNGLIDTIRTKIR